MGYAQNAEDVLVAPWLPDIGKLLDIGACDGVRYSNTRIFMERGWWGVLIEPERRNLDALHHLYRGNTRTRVIEAAVVPNGYRGQTVHLVPNQFIGLASCLELWPEHRRKWAAHTRFLDPIRVLAMRPATLNRLGPFDLVSLDIEGGNVDIARELDWGKLCKSVAIVEHDGQIETLRDLFESAGFALAHMNGENAIFRRN